MTKNDSAVGLELKQKFTFLYIYGIKFQDLKPLIKTLQLSIILTKEIQYADAILTLSSLIKANRKLKQVSQAKKLTVYTIQTPSLGMITKALRSLAKIHLTQISHSQNDVDLTANILSQDFLSPLEEVRLAIE